MKIDCTSNNGRPCLNCEAYMAGYEGGVAACVEKVQAMHRRAQKAEGELAKIGGEPGGLAYLRNATNWWSSQAQRTESLLWLALKAGLTECERLRAVCSEAADYIEDTETPIAPAGTLTERLRAAASGAK